MRCRKNDPPELAMRCRFAPDRDSADVLRARIPDRERLGGGEATSIGREGQIEALEAEIEVDKERATGHVPEMRLAIASGGEERAVGREGEGADETPSPPEINVLQTRLDV